MKRQFHTEIPTASVSFCVGNNSIRPSGRNSRTRPQQGNTSHHGSLLHAPPNARPAVDQTHWAIATSSRSSNSSEFEGTGGPKWQVA
eukprot:912551-Amorphochlora_amoeboformis.AAC.1